MADCAYKLYQSGNLRAAADLSARRLKRRDRHDIPEGLETDLMRYYHFCHYLGRREEALAQFNRKRELLPVPISESGNSGSVGYPIVLDERGSET